jgi:hypothetical protein
VRFQHVADLDPGRARSIQIDIDVAPWVDDRGFVRLFRCQQVGSVAQTFDEELRLPRLRTA